MFQSLLNICFDGLIFLEKECFSHKTKLGQLEYLAYKQVNGQN